MDFTHMKNQCFPAFIHHSYFKYKTPQEVSVYTGGLSDFLLISYTDFKFIHTKLYILGEIIQTSAHHSDAQECINLKSSSRARDSICFSIYLSPIHLCVPLLSAIPRLEGNSFVHHGFGVCLSD